MGRYGDRYGQQQAAAQRDFDTLGKSVLSKVNDKLYLTLGQHGVRQFNSNGEDGVNGITGCAIAPGDSKTYTFQATQYGSSW